MAITLDVSWVADVSMDTYTVGNTSENTITTTRFSRFLTIIEPRLRADGFLNSAGNLDSSKNAEYYAALLICDLIASGPVTDLGIKSEDFGGAYSYTKSDAAASSTKSAFLIKYETALSQRTIGKYASSGQVRRDYQIDFAKLSQGDSPTIRDSSSNYPTI